MPPPAPTMQPVPQLPEFRWNGVAKRYIAPNGQFVSAEAIRGSLDVFIDGVIGSIDDVSRRLAAGEISLAQWQAEMMAFSKEVNLAGAALERGGWFQMTASDFGAVGSKVRGEYGYLSNFASQIESGAQKLDGTFLNRSRLYGEQGRVTYYDFAGKTAIKDGFQEEQSVLTPSESCEECISEDRLGWRPIGSVIPIGDRECLSNCNCFMQYRKRTGEVRTR